MSERILGLGNDIIEIERIRESFSTHGERFLHKLFTPEEQKLFLESADPVPSIAGRFCAKEAIVKALGCGFGKDARWLEISILREASGKPLVHLAPSLSARFDHPRLLLSISHCKHYASAVAIWVHST